jgi:DNA-directed RNA polymerase subunit RPC12/RpoP
MKIKYTYYICRCGRRVIPLTNPCKCPHCGRITRLR